MEFSLSELIAMRTTFKLIASNSCQSSKNCGFSVGVREIFRKDFLMYFNLYKKVDRHIRSGNFKN